MRLLHQKTTLVVAERPALRDIGGATAAVSFLAKSGAGLLLVVLANGVVDGVVDGVEVGVEVGVEDGVEDGVDSGDGVEENGAREGGSDLVGGGSHVGLAVVVFATTTGS
jgi:hypothetical protein